MAPVKFQSHTFQQVLSELSYYKKLLPDSQRKYSISWKSTGIMSKVILVLNEEVIYRYLPGLFAKQN